MSTYYPVEHKCAICGTTHKYLALTSTNTFGGGPDLDLRPAEMARSTMDSWVQECPGCGYVSGSISDPADISREWLKSDRYRNCDGLHLPSLARQFYKQYLICLEENKTEDAFYAVLHAAWDCDDKGDEANAKHCRELAISMADQLIDSDHKHKNEIMLIKTDLLRRTGHFDKLIEEYSGVSFEEEILNKVLVFQLKKAKEKDTACYRVEDANKSQ